MAVALAVAVTPVRFVATDRSAPPSPPSDPEGCGPAGSGPLLTAGDELVDAVNTLSDLLESTEAAPKLCREKRALQLASAR